MLARIYLEQRSRILARAEVASGQTAPNYTEARSCWSTWKEQAHGRCAMNARWSVFRSPAKFCISSLCLALFVAGIGLLRAATPEAQIRPLVLELKLDREWNRFSPRILTKVLRSNEAPGLACC